jgi:hypothetical protein
LCANASLLSMPVVMKTLRVIREEQTQRNGEMQRPEEVRPAEGGR